MSAELLYDQSVWLILAEVLGLFLASSEVGYRIGRSRRPAEPESRPDQLGGIQGALTGLFALLLGFTFAMALSRFDLRREKVVLESNATGTAAVGVTAVLVLLVGLVIGTILDLDRPGRGLIRVGHESLIALQKSLEPR